VSATPSLFEIVNVIFHAVGVELVALKGVGPLAHEVNHLEFVLGRLLARFLHFSLRLFHSLHLVAQLLAVVTQNALSFQPVVPVSVAVAQDGPEDLLSAFLTVVDTEANLHFFGRLQVSVSQLLEKVEDNVCVVVAVVVGRSHHLLLYFLAALYQL